MIEKPFSKILLPVDKSENSKRPIRFVSFLLRSYEEQEVEITLLNQGNVKI